MFFLPLPAQATGPAPIVWVDPRGDTVSPSAGTAQRASIEMLRLSLQGFVPPDRGFGTGCSDYGTNAGSATGMAPIQTQRALGYRFVPGLTLAGFSNGGCPITANLGGGFVFTQPITKHVFLAASGGFIFLPHANAGKPVTQAAGRADIVFTRPDGRAFTVGIGTGRVTGVSFGGLW